MEFDVSSNTNTPSGDRYKVGSNAPFPPGTYYITDVESGRNMGPKFFVFRGDENGIANQRKTWVHSGAGENYKKKTKGCIRAPESSLNEAVTWYRIQVLLGSPNRHRVTVTDDRIRVLRID